MKDTKLIKRFRGMIESVEQWEEYWNGEYDYDLVHVYVPNEEILQLMLRAYEIGRKE